MSEQKEEPAVKMTAEEMERRKVEITKFHKDQIEFLTTQFNYEELLTKIEEIRLRRMVALTRQAQMMAPDPTEDKVPDVPGTATESNVDTTEPRMTVNRTLKKDKE